MVAVSIPLLALAYYLVIAFSTYDLLWFWPGFEEQPVSITIYCYGREMVLEPQSDEFQEMTARINMALTGRKRWDPLSMSEITYQEYQTSPSMLAVEIFYSPPIRIHSRYKFFGSVDALVIPLVGRHAYTNPVFGRRNDFPVAGSMHVESTTPILEYIQEQGICEQP
jgi:hypothetical protein